MRRSALGALALAGAMMLFASCSDLTGPAGFRGIVDIFYKGPPAPTAGDTIQAIVGDTVTPPFEVTLSNAPQTRARYVYSVPEGSSVLTVLNNGARVLISGRGSDTLYATLLGATVGTDSVYRAFIIVNARPKDNSIDSTSLTFNSLGVTKVLTAQSFDNNGARTPLLPGSVVWTSDDTTIATVLKTTTDSARVVSVRNGSTKIRAVFDNIAIDSTIVTVLQTMDKFRLSTPAPFNVNGGGELTLTSLNDTVRVTATPIDANGRDLIANAASFTLPTFVSRIPDRASVNPATGLVTANLNTDAQVPARILVTVNNTIKSDSINVVVQQVATLITIIGKRVDTIPSIGGTRALSAIIKDAKGNDVQLKPVWSSSDPAIAQTQLLSSGDAAVAIDTGTVFIKVSRDQVRDSIVLVVRNDPDKVTLLPDPLVIKNVNDTVTFTSATVTNTRGDPLTSGITLTWTSKDTNLVKTLADGRIIAKAIGATDVIVATSNGKADTSQVLVTNFPASVAITTPPPTIASVGDSVFIGTALANGRGAALTASNAIVSWTSSTGAVRPRIDGSGWVYADAPGQAIIRVTSRGDTLQRAEVVVNVSNATTNVTVSPAAPSNLTSLGQQLTFSATAFNNAGDPVTNPTIRWSIFAGGTFVSIDSITGVATANANGTATVRATVRQPSGDVTKDVSLTVGQVYSPVESEISPAAGALIANGTASTVISYQLQDARGNNLTFGGATLFPSSTRGTLGPVTDMGNGLYTATLTAGTSTGAAILTAAVQGASQIANTGLVQMNPGPAAQYLVTVAPSLAPVAGTAVTVSARIADANGNTIATAGNLVTWGSSGGGLFSSPTSTTDATGLATVTFTTNPTASQHIIQASTGAVTGTTNPPINPVAGIGANYLVTPASTSPVAGSNVVVTAQLRDANNNNVALANQTVTWTKSDANGSFSAPTSLTNAAGVATITFTTHTVSGTATTVTATTGGNNGVTSLITTVPGAASAAQTLITSSAPTVTAGNSVTITVQARDANGNNLTTSADAVTLAVAPTARGTLGGVIAAGGGSYTATFTGSGSGIATFTGTINNVAITDNELVTVNVAAASAATTTASIPAGTAGSLNTITVQAKDAFGNNLTVGGSTVMVSITGANTVASFAATDNGNGTYTATYTPTVIGTDAVSITLGGTPILGSAYSSVVAPGALATFFVEALGQGAIGTQAAGVPFNIRVTARDANGNIVQPFNGTVQLTSTGTLTGSPVTSGAFTNGVLTSQSVTITNTGSFTITATSGSAGTSNSFPVGAGAANAAQSTAVVPAGTAGSVTTISIQAKDANGNNRTSTSGAVVVSVTGSNTATATVNDNLDGTYTATYTPTVAGTDNIAITLSGGAISGSPFTSAVAVGALHHFNIATIAAQTAGAAFATTITAKDLNNNTVTAFVGTADITSTGTLTGTPVTSGAFVAGVRTEPGLVITNVGSFTITATRSGGSETGTSNSFAVAVGAADAPTSTASVPNGTAGSLTSMSIQAKDANGNNRTTGGDAVVVNVTGANIASAGVTDNGNGTYTATYTPTVAGTDNIAITLGGVAISGSPFTSTIAPATLHHFAVTGTGGLPISAQTAGTSFNIRIVAQDANNNTVPGFTGTVDLTSTGALTGSPQTSAAFVAGVLAGEAVTMTNTGTFTITATRTTGGTQTGTSNGFLVVAGAAVAAQSTASVPAGTSGLVTTITVQAKDADNNNRTTSSGAVVVSITGANTATASVTDNLNGTYTATYTPTVAGTDNVAITLGGVAISGSPFSSVVSPASLHHFAVTNTSDLAIGAQNAGSSFDIKVVAQDASNNTVPGFTGTVTITSSGVLGAGSGVTASFVAGVLATHAVTITNTGSFTITATRSAGGAQTGVSNSFAVAAGAADATTSTATVPAGTAGLQTSIAIQAKDANGNNLTVGGSTVMVAVSGANTVGAFAATDNGNGTYTAAYTPTVSGTDNVAITLGGVAISGSPYSSVVSPGAVANFLVEAAGGGAIASQTAGGSFNIRITARDANNNTVTAFNGAGNTVDITSSGTLSAGNGTTATFTAGVLASHAVTITNTGTWTVTATRTAGTQNGSSLSFAVTPGAASAAQSTASVPAGTGGSTTTITVQARDAFGNNRTATSGVVAASITGANTATGNVVDNANGTYTVTYTPAVGGTDAIAITLGGVAIGGSPYSSVVGAGSLDHFQVDAQGGGAIGSQSAGTSFNIRIIAQDANNNTVPGFAGTVNVSSSGTLSAGSGATASFVNGVLAAHAVTVSNTGSFSISVTNGAQNGTSNSFNVGAGAADANLSTASVPAGTAGSLTTILIQAKDALGNNRTSTSGTAVVSVTGANTASASITDNLNGTYTATYTPTIAGTDNIAITLGGVAINGGASPSYTSVVAIGALHHFNIAAIGSQVAGTPFSATITAKDANNNTVTSFVGTVDITSSGTLTGSPVTSGAFTAGTRTESGLTLTNTGSFTITATRTGNTEAGTSNSFSVAPGAASAPQSTGSVPTGIAGSLTTVTIQAKDANSNNRTSTSGAVVVSVTGANTATANVTDNGNGTYSATYTPTVAGTDNIAITLGGVAISGSPFSSVVAPSTLHHFAVTNTSDLPIAGQAAGVAFNVKVVAQDANNNTVTGFTGQVNLTSTGTLTGSPVLSSAFTAGVLSSQSVTITNVGNFSITATRSAGGVQNGTSNTFAVAAGTATALFIATQPSAAPTAGVSFASQPVVFVRDANGNVVTSDNTTIVTATRLGGSGTLQGTTAVTAVNGVATFTNLSHNVANPITIQFTAGGLSNALSGTVTVAPAALDHFSVTVNPAGTKTAGTAFTIDLIAQDAFNNTQTGFATTAVLTSTGALSGTPVTSGAFTAGILNGQSVTITNTGSFTITATASGKTGTTSAITVQTGAAVAAQSTASVPAGTAGSLTSITVQAKDANGNNRTSTSGAVVINITGANTATPSVTDNGDGTYSASYTPTVSGTDNVAITLGGVAIGGSPYSSVVSAGALDHFTVAPNPVSTKTAGTSFNVDITAKDVNNNTVTAFTGTGNAVDITSTGTLSAGSGTTATFTSGVLTHAVTISNTGSFTITATKTGGTQNGTTAAITVQANTATAAQTTASVPSGTAGSVTTITVQAKDANGNNRTTTSGTVAATVTGANAGKTVGVVDNANGTYTLTYTPTAVGTDNIAITLAAVAIGGSPYASAVGAGAIDHFSVELQGGGGIPGQTAGTSFNVRVVAHDLNDNTVTSYSGAGTAVNLTSTGTLTGTPVATGTFTNGVLASQAVTITNIGSFTLTATRIAGGAQTGTSNSFAVITGAANAATSTASVPAGTAGAVTTITVQAKDASGNNRTTTSGAVVVSVTGANTATASVTDNLNGTYTATYTPTASGTDNIAITLGGAAISGSPFTSAVAVGALDHFDIAAVGAQTAGSAFNIAITAKDAGGNTVTGFVGTVVLTSTGTLTGAPLTSGAFTAGVRAAQSVTITNTGSFTITATNSGKTGTTNSFAVAAGATVAAQSTASVPSTGTAGSLSSMTIQAKDANGNNRTSGGDVVAVNVTGANVVAASVTDNSNGTYTATYTPTVAGTDNIAITIGGGAISGSPFTSTISAATLHHFAVTNTSDTPIGGQAAGTPFNIKVVAQDANNNTVTGFTGTVTISSTGTLSAGSGVTAALTAGVLSSHAVTISNTGNFTITATRTTGGAQSGTSNSFLVQSGAATALFLAQTPSAAPTAGVAFAQQPVVYVRDANGNVVTTDNTTVITASTATGTGSVQGTTSITAVNGVATFTNLSHNVANTITIQFTAGGLSTATSGNVVVAPAALDHFAFATVATQTAGTSFSVDLTAQDAFNNTVTSFVSTVQLTSTGTLTGTPVTTGAFVGGLRTQSGLTITNTGSFTLTATGGGKTGTSNAFTTNVGAVSAAASTASVPNGTAGSVTSITVQAKDAAGNNRTTGGSAVVITITGSNSATPTVTDNGNGTYSASYTPTVSGSDNVAITLGGVAISGSPYTSTVSAGALSQFTFAAIGGQTAGSSFNVAITARDANSNVVTGFTGTVVLTSTGTLTGTPLTSGTFVAGVRASQAVTITNTGTFTLTATRSAGTEAGTSASFAVAAGAASAATSTASVPAGTAGSATSVTVQSKDANGNNRTTGGATVVATVSGANTATPTVTDVGNGTYTFSYTPTVAGTDAISITLGGTAISGSPYSSVVGPGALDHFSVELQGGGGIPSQTAGTSFNLRIVAHDVNDNVVTSFSGAGNTVDITSSGTLSAGSGTTAVFTNGVLASHAVTISNTGNFSITATKTSDTEAGTSNTFAVVPGAANAAQSTASVPAGTAGVVTTITIQAKDANGNNRTATSGAVVVSVTGANTATASVTDNLNGTYTATYTPTASGNDNIAITLGGGAISGSPFTSAVAVGALHHFNIAAIGSQTAGGSFNIAITAKDAGNNTVTGFTGTVNVTSTGTLSAGSGPTAAFTAGVLASHAVTISNTGSFTITATKTITLETGTSNSFSVVAGATVAAQSTASVPSTGTSGSLTSITIQAKDANGNNRTSGGDVVVVSVTGANTASAGVTDNSNGTYTATYTPTVAGADNIAITIGGGAISGSPFTSTIGAATLHHFAVTNTSDTPIGTQTAGTSFNIKVVAQDANNNTVSGFTGTVTISSTGTLSAGSGVTAALTAGVLASHAVTVSNTGNFTITATRTTGGAQTGTSNSFLVNSGAATALFLAQSPSAAPTAGVAFAQQPVVYVRDGSGNIVTGDNTTVVTAATASGSGAVQGSTSVTAVNGVATFTNLSHNVANTITIDFTAGGLATATSGNVVVGHATLDHFAIAAIGAQAAGAAFNITITAQDVFNNTVTAFSGAGNTAVITTTGTPAAQGTTGNFASGIYTPHSVTINNTGSFTVTATGGGKTGTSNSFSVAAGVVSATASTATVPAGTAGAVTTITVQARDAAGNPRTNATGITAVAASVTGANTATPGVVNNGDGTYTLTYTPTASGTDNVAITMDIGGGAVAISGSPYSSLVAAGALDHFAVAPTVGGNKTAGSSFNVLITAQDANNNTVTSFAGVGNAVNISSTGTLSAGSGTTATFTAGTLTHAVTISNTGSFTITATKTGGTQTGTSSSITVVAGAAVAAQSTASVPAGTAGSLTTITIQAKDANGNNLTGGGATVQFSVSGANTVSTTAAIDNTNGTYTATYTPSASGTDAITITLNASAISGSPYQSVVGSGALDHFSVEVQGGGGIPSQTAATSFNIRVVAHDVNDNVVTSFTGAGNTVDITSSGTLSAGSGTTATFVNGVLASHAVTISNTGSFTITATKTADTEAGTSNSFTVNTGAASAAQSTASVPAGTAGAVTTITIQAKDAQGNNRTSTSGAVVVSVTGANTATASVTDNLNGTYTATYTPTASGTDNVAITLGGGAISGSPYSSVVTHGALDHFAIAAIGSQVAGAAFNITITAQDAFNNTVLTYSGAGNTAVITTTGTPAAQGTTGNFASGIYTPHSVTINNTGSFTVTATGSGKTGTSNSFSVAAGAVSATASTATVPAGTAGSVTTITVQARDANGNARTNAIGITAVAASVTGANTATPGVVNNGDGTYTLTYTPTASGTDNVAITMNIGGGPVAISGSPYTSIVSPGALDHFAVAPTVGGNRTAGSSFNVLITAQDANNNTVTSFAGVGNAVNISSTGTLSAGSGTTATFTAGTLTHAVTISNTGSFTVTATKTGGTQSGTSASITVQAAAAAAAQSTASVPAGTAGALTTITIQAKDANGNNVTTGGATVQFSVSGANTVSTTAANDNTNGTYTATYTPSASGTDAITITLNASAISGSPYQSVVGSGALDHFSVELQGGGGIPSQTAATSFNIRVVAHDANENVVTSFTGGANTVDITSSGTLSAGSGTTAAFVNGVLSSHAVTISNTGSFTITATFTGNTEAGTSNAFTVNAGAASAAQSTASVPAGTAGAVTTITIQAKDAQGNNRTSTSGAVVVSVTGANTATASVTDNLNGTYTATYTPTASGTDNVAITLGGGAISGSPYSSVVTHGALDHFSFATIANGQIAGTPFNTTITARDAFNNTVLSFTGGGNQAVITTTGTPTSQGTTGNFTNGVFTNHAVTINNTGTFTVTATGSGKTGTSNSFTVVSDAAVAAQSTATVPNGTAGAATSIVVQARDANGNALTVGGETVVITITGANSATPVVTDNLNGTYSASYTPTATGSDNVAITLGGNPISGSPFTSVVSPGALDHFAFGAIATQTAGTPFTVAITAQDANNNTVTGFTGTVVLTSTGTLTGAPLTSGTFTAGVRAAQSVTITNTGSFTLTATRSAGTESGSSASFTVNAGAASAAQSTASVPSGSAGSVTTITVQAKDANGNNRTGTSGAVVGSVSGANTGATVNVLDNLNGTYTLTYTPTATGTDAITITLGGSPINGSPYSSIVGAGALDHFSVENVGGGGIPTQKAGTSFNIRIVAHDAFDNVVPSFSGGSNTVDITSGDGATFSIGGTTTAAFVNGILASHTVRISNDGEFSITATFTGDTETGTSNTFTVLGIPVALAASGNTTTSFTANWNAFTDASSYRLDVSASPTFAGFVSGYSNKVVSGTSDNVTGLTAGTIYYYRVRASVGGIITSSSDTIATAAIPNAPVAIAATAVDSTSLTANWNAATGATSYRLDVATDGGFSGLVVTDMTVAGTSQSVTGLLTGTQYFYRVRAVNAGGASANSNTVDTLTIPSAPASQAATNTVSNAFDANWSSVTGATNYRLDVATDLAFTAFVVGYQDVSTGNVLTYNVSGLDSGTTYYYRVRAENNSGVSDNSASQTVITAPVAIAASNIVANTSFDANWKPSPNSVEFFIDVSTDNTFSVIDVLTNTNVGNVNTFTVTVGTGTYYYRVRVNNGDGTSASSNVITVVVP